MSDFPPCAYSPHGTHIFAIEVRRLAREILHGVFGEPHVEPAHTMLPCVASRIAFAPESRAAEGLRVFPHRGAVDPRNQFILSEDGRLATAGMHNLRTALQALIPHRMMAVRRGLV